MSEEHPDDQVGSVGEEAAKLFGAFADLARGQGSDVGAGLAGLASYAAGALRDVDEHLATDDPECTYCPICRTVHLVRQTSPEVREHLTAAAASLAQAVAGMLATPVPEERRNRAAGVERIDLGEDVPDDGWAEDE